MSELSGQLRRKARGVARRVQRLIYPPPPPARETYLPAPGDDYWADFTKGAEAFLDFLRRTRLPRQPAAGTPAGVVVMPWSAQPTPWYAVALAIGLVKRGRRVTLIFNDVPFPRASQLNTDQYAAIERVLAQLGKTFPIVRLSRSQAQPLTAQDDEAIRRVANLNVTWQMRAGDLGQPAAAEDQQQLYRAGLGTAQGLLKGLLASQPFEYLLVPGGLYSSSGLFTLTGRAQRLRVASYDYGYGLLFLCTDGVAAHQADIPRAFDAIWQAQSEGQKQQITALAKQEFAQRVAGRDRTSFQKVGAAGQPLAPAGSVLLPLNVDWDASALGHHAAFANSLEWLQATVAFALEHSTAQVIVRQHPAERNEGSRSQLDLRGLLAAAFGSHPRYRFVAAEADVNTYDLMQAAGLVLPYVSTIGIEAAALGHPVIVAGSSYYADLGIVRAPRTRADYFAVLEQGLRGRLPALPEQAERAWLAYYLTQICNRVWTRFTPMRSDFWQWCLDDPETVFADPIVDDLLTAIDTNVPIALLRHQRRRPEALANLAPA